MVAANSDAVLVFEVVKEVVPQKFDSAPEFSWRNRIEQVAGDQKKLSALLCAVYGVTQGQNALFNFDSTKTFDNSSRLGHFQLLLLLEHCLAM